MLIRGHAHMSCQGQGSASKRVIIIMIANFRQHGSIANESHYRAFYRKLWLALTRYVSCSMS